VSFFVSDALKGRVTENDLLEDSKTYIDEEEDNSVLVNPSDKVPVYDNFFFKQGMDFNQGSIFDWEEKDFLIGLDKVVEKFNNNPENKNGLKLQSEFSYEKMVNNILSIMQSI